MGESVPGVLTIHCLETLTLYQRLIHKKFKAGQQKVRRTWGDSKRRARATWMNTSEDNNRKAPVQLYTSSNWTSPEALAPLEQQLCLWTLELLVGGWPPFILPTRFTFRAVKIYWRHNSSAILQIFHLIWRAETTTGFSKVGHGISGGKQSSLSVFHVISLLGQIDSIWKIDKKHWFLSSQDYYCNLSAFSTEQN